MGTMLRRAWTSLVVLASATVSVGQEPAPPADFYGRVQPLLAIHCYKCHGSEVQKGGLRLDVRERALKGGESGHSGPAELVRRIVSTDRDEQMPPKGPRLSAGEIETLKRWAAAGAPWPDRDDYWAFQPPKDAVPPTVTHPERILNPIDAFIEARLEREGLRPVAPADRRTLLRRAYADLLGVPPSPDEAEAFLRDDSADPFEKLIDRLLADPRYGERWARHWLDLVRYGESDGYEDDKIRPHAWRYRD
jgi:mono/diheme cytochrome c family protein